MINKLKNLFLSSDKKRNYRYFKQLYLSPDRIDSTEIKSKIKTTSENPGNLLNFYNYYLHYNKKYAFDLLSKFMNSTGILPVSRIDITQPMFIDNIHVQKEENRTFIDSSKISIIMTAYNEAELIAYSTLSLLNQSQKNIEIIFVDDKSDDNTLDIFQETCIANNFSNYKIIYMKKNSGPFVSRNIGIKYCTGEYITFHDADDWAHTQRLEEQVKILENNDKIASISQLVRIKQNGELFSKHIYPLNRIAMVSLMVKRDVLKDLGYFYTDLLGADTEYFERIKYYYGENKIEKIKKVLTFAAHRPNSRTTSEVTGTPEFGTNPLRKRHGQMLEERLFEMVNGYKSYHVDFDAREYEYEIIK